MKTITALSATLAIALGAVAQTGPAIPTVVPTGSTPAPATPAPGASTVDLSQLPAFAPPKAMDGTVHSPTATTDPVPGNRNANGKAKKTPVSAGGTWRWSSPNRNGMMCENVLTLTVAKNGKISGKLVDRTGEHEIKDATLGDGVVTFDLKFHTRGEGDLPHTYTVSLDPDNPQVTVDQPDLTPFGKARGGKHHSDHSAKHDTSG